MTSGAVYTNASRSAVAWGLTGLFALAVVSSSPAAQTTQNFDSDPGWVYSDPHPLFTSSLNDYGYQPTSNFADGANAGEVGGITDTRRPVPGPPRGTYFAAEVTGLNGSTPLQATGRYVWDELEGATSRDNGSWHFGWFNSSEWDSANQFRPKSGIAFFYDSRNHFITTFRPGETDGGGLRREGENVLPEPKVPSIDGCGPAPPGGGSNDSCPGGAAPTGAPGGKTFELAYDPNGGSFGTASILITDANDVTYSRSINLTSAERDSLDATPLDRFGIFMRHGQGLDDPNGDTRATRVWFDDLTYTSSADVVSLTGDYNGDNSVDAADYVVWRKTNINGEQGYIDWRANFGAMGGAGSGVSQSAVPEPASALLLVIGMFGLGVRRRG